MNRFVDPDFQWKVDVPNSRGNACDPDSKWNMSCFWSPLEAWFPDFKWNAYSHLQRECLLIFGSNWKIHWSQRKACISWPQVEFLLNLIHRRRLVYWFLTSEDTFVSTPKDCYWLTEKYLSLGLQGQCLLIRNATEMFLASDWISDLLISGRRLVFLDSRGNACWSGIQVDNFLFLTPSGSLVSLTSKHFLVILIPRGRLCFLDTRSNAQWSSFQVECYLLLILVEDVSWLHVKRFQLQTPKGRLESKRTIFLLH